MTLAFKASTSALAMGTAALITAQTPIRRWYRGDAGTNERGVPYDYHWAPAPAELRRVAMAEHWRVKQRAEMLRKLLLAEPLIEFNDEHRRHMCGKLSELKLTIGIPPVGKDGSGG